MMYAIKILQKVIQEHLIAIKKLDEAEHEMNASQIFADEEILERRNS